MRLADSHAQSGSRQEVPGCKLPGDDSEPFCLASNVNFPMSLTIELGLSKTYGVFIDNHFRPLASETFEARHSRTDDMLARIARCGEIGGDSTGLAATKALTEWRAKSPEERSFLLMKLTDAVEADAQRLACIDRSRLGMVAARPSFLPLVS